ncbi:MAG: hypothetical protein K0V04_39065 [Deltaproteobacteria bacterium]|nr:hypothetical protein [Deltaproteobacteria bacterium]
MVAPLSPAAMAVLKPPSDDDGARIYTGSVVPKGEHQPAFWYERRVAQGPDGMVSRHLSYRAGSDDVVLSQRAVHSEHYALRRFEEVHGQTGVVSAAQVLEDGSLELTTTRGDRTRRRTERPGAPVVVGPTLFGYVLHNWDALIGGERLPVRFAAPEQARSYEFTLQVVEATPHTTSIAFRASSALVRMGVDTMTLVFDTRTRKILRYVGRVPPRLERLAVFDAQVDYTFVAADYR